MTHLVHYATGIDEIGTMNADCSGWTIVSIDHLLLSKFNENAEQILKKSKLSVFHGKKIQRKKRAAYVNFLMLIKEMLESGSGFASCTLLGRDWKSEFDAFCKNVIGDSFANVGIQNEKITDASWKLAAPLFTYQRLAHGNCQGGSTIIYIDRHAFFDELNSSVLQIAEVEISSHLPIISALRAYGRERFPNAPEVKPDGITICADEDSFLVQAADIIGNFATAYAFKQLGKQSNTNELKCSIFEEVFHDILDLNSFPSMLQINGEDLALDADAASFTFSIS